MSVTTSTISIVITEYRPDGTSHITTRWLREGTKGISSADNLGRDYLEHSDEEAGRLALAGWLKSQAERITKIVKAVVDAPKQGAFQ